MSANTILGNGMRLWYFLVRVCGRLENPLQHKHSLLHYVANEKKGILYANDFECARFAGENMFCHANVLLANDIQSLGGKVQLVLWDFTRPYFADQ